MMQQKQEIMNLTGVKKTLKEMAKRADFPVLGANLEKEKAGVLDEVKPYTVKE